MTVRMKGTLADFDAFLLKVDAVAPKAVEKGLREGAVVIQGQAVQLTPVDQGQMKASWRTFPIPGGAVVTNIAGHAAFVERGRGPGPVPVGPIMAWMNRHGIPAEALHGILKKIAASGYQARWPLKNAIAQNKERVGRIIKASLDAAIAGLSGSGGSLSTSDRDESGNTRAGYTWVKKHTRTSGESVRGHWRKL